MILVARRQKSGARGPGDDLEIGVTALSLIFFDVASDGSSRPRFVPIE